MWGKKIQFYISLLPHVFALNNRISTIPSHRSRQHPCSNPPIPSHLEHQIPPHQRNAQPYAGPKHHAGHTPPLSCAFQLPVAAADVLGRTERIGDQLLHVRGLEVEVLRQRGLQRGDFQEGRLRRSSPGWVVLGLGEK